MPENNKLIRLPQVRELTGLGRSTLYARIKSGGFPAPVNIGVRAVAWRADAVIAWIDSRTRTPQA